VTPGDLTFYRLLLHLYPAGFRAEYQQPLIDAYTERARSYRGPMARVQRAAAAVSDVLPNAAAAHGELLRQDLRYALRSLRRTPGFALTAILVIALGVGANTAAFSLADFVLLRPLAFPQPDRLVRLWQSTPGYDRMEFSPANYRDAQAMTHSFSGSGAFTDVATNLVGSGEPRRLTIELVTPGLMRVLGVPALAGRVITPADSANANVVVLGFGLWQTQFGGDPHIVGSIVKLDDTQCTVIGVMPATFAFPDRDADAWRPLIFDERYYENRADNFLGVVARLRDGVTIERANADIVAAAARLRELYPKANEGTTALVSGMRDEMSERARLLVVALCGAALCILLLACANLASLLLTRATHRRRELAVRAALGAGRERLVRQLVTESIALAVLGGIVGVLVAYAALPLVARLSPPSLPTAEQPSVDLRVLLVAGVIVILTGLAFGVGPAIVAGRSKALEALRSGARGGVRKQRLRAILVTLEVAASVVLLVSSGLLIRAVLRIQATDPGFRAERVLLVRTELTASRYAVTARRGQFYHRVLDEVRAMSGVVSAGYTSGVPMTMKGGIWPVSFGREAIVRDRSTSASLRFVTPQYFATMAIPLRAGRDVAETDTRESPAVAVVSESMARRFWPNDSPLGKRFTFAMREATVVGVVGDVRVRGLERPSEPQVYLPAAQMADSTMGFYQPKDLVVRSTVPVGTLATAIRRIVAAADPEQPVSDVQPLGDIIARETTTRVTQVRVLGVLAGIALMIAGVGVHGLLALAVSQRSREIGVRRALGEQVGSIVSRVLREGMALALAGVAIGVFVAYLGARTMGALLAGVEPGDPMTITGAAVLCLVVAVAGCVRPAMRAARVDPVAVLRGD
jgi:putative ABC transport system permease protein